MKKVILFSSFLLLGLILSQVVPSLLHDHAFETYAHITRLFTTTMLGFIMIRVGYEFDLDKTQLRSYGWDYVVAATAATIPWILVALYFVFIIPMGEESGLWQKALLTSRFASPTSAGVLFSMLAAAGLAGTWMYKKIRLLAIFDDLDTVLLMIPLQMMLVGLKWQLGVAMIPLTLLLIAAWKYLHRLRLPVTWPWILGYGTAITLVSEVIYLSSKLIDKAVPIHIEVLLPAFVLGCVMVRHKVSADRGDKKTRVDITEKHGEQLATVIVSTIFMALVGLSMPPVVNVAGPAEVIEGAELEMVEAYVPAEKPATQTRALSTAERVEPQSPSVTEQSQGLSWLAIAFHVLMVTILSNIGKCFPFFCYKKEATWRERLALAVGMFPRGEVGAGVLIVSISYGIDGAMLTVAMLSLALNLLLTGAFIVAVKKLLHKTPERDGVLT